MLLIMFTNMFTIVYKLREKHIQQVIQGENDKQKS